MTTLTPTPDTRTDTVTVHVDDVGHLLDYATRSAQRTDLVLTPEQLHARNLKRRLATASQPRSSLQFCDLSSVASDVLQETGDTSAALDRIDRIRTLEGLLDERPDEFRHFESLFGTRLSSHVSTIESARAAVDAVTAYDPDRLAVLDELVETTPLVAQRDARSLVDGAVATERLLAATSDVAVSGDAVLRAATTSIRETDGIAFEETCPDVERLHLAGVSSVAATLRDFLVAVAEETAVDVRLFARPGTGPGITGRLRGTPVTTWDERAPQSVSLDASITEMVATTREQEARLVVALVTRLVDSGVSPSDVLVVARDVDGYERVLSRAAKQYRQSLSFWTQLSVTGTRPYTLVESVCTLLDARDGPLSLETVCRPLFAEWVDPGGGNHPPLPRRALDDARATLDAQDQNSRSLSEWRTHVAETPLPERVARWLQSLLTWAAEQPSKPEPADVRETITPLLDVYRDVVLPAHRERDDASLAATTETARALVRLERLVDDVARKYVTWLERGQTDQTWEVVRYLFETIATVKPGRREHANAGVVDVVDATDTWARTAPYVVAVGLVDGVWPLPPEGLFPVEVRDALLGGPSPAARNLAPREGWTGAREFDHFIDAVSTATEYLVCTRHERSADGSVAHRSPFFDALEATPTRVGQSATTRLLGRERTLPEPLAGVVGRQR